MSEISRQMIAEYKAKYSDRLLSGREVKLTKKTTLSEKIINFLRRIIK